jgi:hypothetical protein
MLTEVNGDWQPAPLPDRVFEGENYRVQFYRPRVEGLFARVERWTNLQTGEMHWRSVAHDNITTIYGKDDNSRIVNPVNANELRREFYGNRNTIEAAGV